MENGARGGASAVGLAHRFISHEKLIGSIGESERWIALSRVDIEQMATPRGRMEMASQVRVSVHCSSGLRGFGSTRAKITRGRHAVRSLRSR